MEPSSGDQQLILGKVYKWFNGASPYSQYCGGICRHNTDCMDSGIILFFDFIPRFWLKTTIPHAKRSDPFLRFKLKLKLSYSVQTGEVYLILWAQQLAKHDDVMDRVNELNHSKSDTSSSVCYRTVLNPLFDAYSMGY